MSPINPLKPHTVRLASGKFAVRKLTLFGWRYYDNQRVPADWWWQPAESSRVWYELDTLHEALILLALVYRRKRLH